MADSAKEQGKDKFKSVVGESEEGGELMEHLQGTETATIRSLIIFVPSVYLAWWLTALLLSMFFGISGEGWKSITFMEPFDHIAFSPVIESGAVEGENRRPLVNWLSMVMTMTLPGPWLLYLTCRPHANTATDVSTAFNALHFFLCTTITQVTPENWIWWATTMSTGFFLGRSAEFLIAKIKKKKKPRRATTGEKATPYKKWTTFDTTRKKMRQWPADPV